MEPDIGKGKGQFMAVSSGRMTLNPCSTKLFLKYFNNRGFYAI